MKFLLLILKNIRRNPVLSLLTSLGTIVLVLVVTLVWSVLAFLDAATSEKQRNLKAIITERWQIPSQMPFSYANSLTEGAAHNEGDLHPDDSMTWSFYGGCTDIKNRTLYNTLFAFALEPKKLTTMIRYATTHRCRQLEILDYFGDPNAHECTTCDSCRTRKNHQSRKSVPIEPASGGRKAPGTSPPPEPPTAINERLLDAIRAVLSGVARAKGRFGKQLIARMFRVVAK